MNDTEIKQKLSDDIQDTAQDLSADEEKSDKPAPLWTKNFTILTVGTIISNLGNVITGFAMALLVLDYTGSTFLYSLFMAANMLPQIVMPILAGPYLDRFSRRKAIYTLDFISAGMFILFAVILGSGFLNYPILIVCCLILGSINSIYGVAYESFYPLLLTKGNFSKAYSISSTLQTLMQVMTPISALVYNAFGMVPLLIIDGVSFLIAAIFETQIKVKEQYVAQKQETFSFKRYKNDFREGIHYLREEKGLQTITAYFFISSLASGAYGVVMLPYFKSNFNNGEYYYMLVMLFYIVGRVLGGAVHYKLKLPVDKKFTIAIFVYGILCVLEGSILFMPLIIMQIFCLASGLLGVTSFNIRIAATQSYVPDEKKARFNGIFSMALTLGTMVGNLTAGAMSELIPERLVLVVFMSANLIIGVFGIMFRNRKHVKKIYNRTV